MFCNSDSVSGLCDVRAGVGKVEVGKLIFKSAERPGTLLMVVGLNEVHGLICLISHQKCFAELSRRWMLICLTSAGAGFGDVR